MMITTLLRASSEARLRYWCTLALAVLCALHGVPTLASEPNVEQEIKAGLVPPVLVKGEPLTLMPLSARMEALHVPAVSIAVIHQGKLVWAGGFGRRSQGGPPVTTDTLFQAGSVSKALTAAAVMSLVQARKLDLDVDVNQYLKSWKLSPSPLTEHRPVTLRELLSHSGGVNNSGFGGYEVGRPVPTLVQVLDGEPPATNPPIRVDIEPGMTWRYSGGGYTIAQQVLIDTTGRTFPDLMRERVLVPFGMNQSSFQQPPTPDFLRRAATPYAADGTAIKGGPHVYPTMAPAGLWTTPSDLARYAIGVQQAFGGHPNRALSEASAHAMLSPVRSTSGAPLRTQFPDGVQPGIGFIIGGRTDKKYFVHPGSNDGYACYLLAYDSGDGAVIMTNSNSGQLLIAEILRTIAYASNWPDYTPAQRSLVAPDFPQFDRYVGAYQSSSGELAILWREGARLESRLWGEPAQEIFPSSTSEYFEKTATTVWAFSGDGTGTATEVKRSENGRDQLLKKLGDHEGDAVLEQSIKTERRVKDQTPAPGGEQALLKSIADLARGDPNYEQVVPEFANRIRQELNGLQKFFAELGPVQSASFKRVLPGGTDVYSVTFQHGLREMEVLLAPDGRIYSMNYN
jgi:CubicO group peptidase (beta-lactamase class C family)